MSSQISNRWCASNVFLNTHKISSTNHFEFNFHQHARSSQTYFGSIHNGDTNSIQIGCCSDMYELSPTLIVTYTCKIVCICLDTFSSRNSLILSFTVQIVSSYLWFEFCSLMNSIWASDELIWKRVKCFNSTYTSNHIHDANHTTLYFCILALVQDSSVRESNVRCSMIETLTIQSQYRLSPPSL